MQVTFGLARDICNETGIPIWSNEMRELIEELEDVRNGTEDRVNALAYAHCRQILGRKWPDMTDSGEFVGRDEYAHGLYVLDSCLGHAQRFILAHSDEFETDYDELADIYGWRD